MSRYCLRFLWADMTLIVTTKAETYVRIQETPQEKNLHFANVLYLSLNGFSKPRLIKRITIRIARIVMPIFRYWFWVSWTFFVVVVEVVVVVVVLWREVVHWAWMYSYSYSLLQMEEGRKYIIRKTVPTIIAGKQIFKPR